MQQLEIDSQLEGLEEAEEAWVAETHDTVHPRETDISRDAPCQENVYLKTDFPQNVLGSSHGPESPTARVTRYVENFDT